VLFVLALLTSVGAASPDALAAQPTVVTHYCSGSFHAKGEQWGYESKVVSCGYARHWSKAFLRHGRHPQHWSCVDLGDSGACDKRHSRKHFDYYAMD
jgi:hypothetical protein